MRTQLPRRRWSSEPALSLSISDREHQLKISCISMMSASDHSSTTFLLNLHRPPTSTAFTCRYQHSARRLQKRCCFHFTSALIHLQTLSLTFYEFSPNNLWILMEMNKNWHIWETVIYECVQFCAAWQKKQQREHMNNKLFLNLLSNLNILLLCFVQHDIKRTISS